MINANKFTEVNDNLIPTGKLPDVKSTPMDFTGEKEVGKDIEKVKGGYDHNYVLRGPSGGALRLIAVLDDPASGRRMELLSDQPGVQLYTGNFIDGTTVGKSGKIYRQGDGIALEPQHFPDSPNRPEFPSVRLDPGQEYRNVMIFRMGVSGR